MSSRVDPGLLSELKEYGEANVEKCFNCGNCTAICPLATDATPFPRNNIRLLQLGLRERMQQSLDPWLCYYCGDCSATCPRQAEPAEAQMTMRRWLTAQYDWTGLARKFYTSKWWELGSVLLLSGILVLLVFVRIFGADRYGAQRSFFDGSVQPSEIAKLIVILYIADWLASKGDKIRDVNYGLIPFASPGKDHAAHRLSNLGLGHRGAALALYGLGIAGGLAAWLLLRITPAQAYGVAAVLLLAVLAAVFLLERAPYERQAKPK